MTSSEMPTRIAMPMPFASGASATRATIESVSGDNLNYVDGFPGKYSLPASEGGKYVSRGEMNAIGNMASNDLHYFKCGGLNTFDAAFCEAVGGYPKGAVLDYINGYKLYRVISLVDSNTVDFLAEGVDGINWKYLNQDTAEPEREVVFGFAINASSEMMIGVFRCLKTTDVFLVENKIEKTYSGGYTLTLVMSGEDMRNVYTGAAVLLYDLGTSYTEIPSPYVNWKTLYGSDGFLVFTTSEGVARVAVSDARRDSGAHMAGLTKDHYYAVVATGAFKDCLYEGQDASVAMGTSVSVSVRPFSLSGTFKIFY